jgi:putative ABC transport system ATP-binding protein
VDVGLEVRLHHLLSQLSGREHQRVAISRVLINYPKLILADESTGTLEIKSGEEFVELLRRFN